MRRLIGSSLLVLGIAAVPSLASAQRRAAPPARAMAQHEFGVDVGLDYAKPDNVSGGIEIFTPVDVRVGFRTSGKLMWEPRVSFALTTWGGATSHNIGLGIAGLYAMSPTGHTSGMYFSGGAGVVLVGGGGTSGTNLSLGAAIGWRKPYGSGAMRYEIGIRYDTKNDAFLPATIRIGGRIGLSLFH
jgi:hypothetical protein